MERDFNEWLATFTPNLATYDYFVDFNKVYEHLAQYKVELNLLNSLIGSSNIEQDFRYICETYPQSLKVIPYLLAIRTSQLSVQAKQFDFDNINTVNTTEDYIEFMKETGLFDMLQNHNIHNLYDYALGIEVGLDTNARKNRSGNKMEEIVESYFTSSHLLPNKDYFKEPTLPFLKKQFGLDLSYLTTKKFDFALVRNKHIYLIETNFYATHGSKISETARSYKLISQQITSNPPASDNPQPVFVWFTDGNGWLSSKKTLQDVFNSIPHLYNLHDLQAGILNKLK
jgi:type II restriction enzyme